MAQGFTRSQARGHPKKDELPLKLERKIQTREGRRANPNLVYAKNSKKPHLIKLARIAYSTGEPDDLQNPYFIQFDEAVSNDVDGKEETFEDVATTNVKGLAPGAFYHVEDEYIVIVKRRTGYYAILIPQGTDIGGPFKTKELAENFVAYYITDNYLDA